VDGMIVMSNSPGLGIEFDEDKLKMFQHRG